VNLHAREETAEVYGWNPAVDETTFLAPPSPTLPAAGPSPFVPPNNDPTARPGVLGVMTHRPTTNPLTASDAGASATVSTAAFTQRIQGFGDKSVNSGSITGLSFNTLYFIYYDDIGFAGGAVTYAAATTKETAINGAGRFFIGSIRTPVNGEANTLGNNDGGVGAQSGGRFITRPTSHTDQTAAWTNESNAYDADLSSFASGASANGDLYLKGLPTLPTLALPSSLTLVVKHKADCTAGNKTQIFESTDGGATLNGPIIERDGTYGALEERYSLPVGTNLALYQIVPRSSPEVGKTHDVHDVWIEAEL